MTYETITEQTCGVHAKMERRMLNITYKDRKTNIWARERTKVIDVISNVRNMYWTSNCLKDDRWTSRVTSCSPCDKNRQGRPAKQWRDDVDKYWSDTIWQRTDGMLRHSANHGTLRLPNDGDEYDTLRIWPFKFLEKAFDRVPHNKLWNAME